MVHIYVIENSVCLLSDALIEYGKVQVLGKEKKLVDEFEIINTNYKKHLLSVPKGKYLIRFLSSKNTSEKIVFLKEAVPDISNKNDV